MTNKKGTIAIGVISLLFVGTAIYFVIKGLRAKGTPQGSNNVDDKKKDVGTTSTTTTPSTSTTTTPSTQETYTEFVFPIRRSQKNDSVGKLQELLLKVDSKSLPKFGADKFFGTETETALFKVLGKKSVSSQADIDVIKQKAIQKTIGALSMQNSLASIGL